MKDKKENFSEGLVIVLRKMCEYGGVDYDDVDFNQENWFLKTEWSKEDEAEFIGWLAEEIRTNKTVRTDVTSFRYKPNKKTAEHTAKMFNLNYGWRTKTRTKTETK